MKCSVILRLLHAVNTLLLFQVLVCLIDFIYPPKPVSVATRTEPKLEKEKGEEENYGRQASGDELVRINSNILFFICYFLFSDSAQGDRYLDIRF